MSLTNVMKETGMPASEVKVIHTRPALVQELNWRPLFSPGSSAQTDSIKTIVFSFYNDDLYQIVVDYDSSRTKGLMPEDLVEAISTTYGVPTAPTPTFITISSSGLYSDSKLVDARWEDAQYAVTLFHSSSYQPVFGMSALSKRLDGLARTARHEAIQLDKQDAPQREVERKRQQDEKDRSDQEDARALNKPTFRF
jgi:hypothetical protein